MQFDHVGGGETGILVQVVDILRHHGWDLARPVQARQRPMPAAGFCAAELLIHGETPPPAVVSHLLAIQKVAEIYRPHLGPQAAGGAEIRNPALGGDARPGERHNDLGVGHQAPQALDSGGEVKRGHMDSPRKMLIGSRMTQFKQA